jgi:hypothetical protein
MIKLLACLLFGQLLYGESVNPPVNRELPDKHNHKDDRKLSKIVVYRDRCMSTTWIKVGEKIQKINVPGSIDPQSILFDQKDVENPTYEIDKGSESATEAELILYPKGAFSGELTYGFTGINWHAHYVVELNDAFSSILNFSGFISIDNQSGASFEDSCLRLIDSQTDNLTKNQSFNEYTVSVGQSLQKWRVIRIPWVNMSDQDTEQDYRFDVGGECLLNLQGVEKHLPLQVYLSFKQGENSKKDLAGGDLALYVRDEGGHLRFLGINQFKTTKSNEVIQFAIPLHLLIQLKSSQDSPLSQIQGVLEQTEFKTLITEKLEEAAYRFTIRNFGDKEVTVKVMLPSGDNLVKVVRESNEHKSESDRSVYWQIKVSPKTEVILRYRVQLMKE